MEGAEREALIRIEVDLHSESELADLHLELMAVLDDVEEVVSAFDPMRQRVDSLIVELLQNAPALEDLEESLEFLRWIYNGYFTFTGCVEYNLVAEGSKQYLCEVAESRWACLENMAARHAAS